MEKVLDKIRRTAQILVQHYFLWQPLMWTNVIIKLKGL